MAKYEKHKDIHGDTYYYDEDGNKIRIRQYKNLVGDEIVDIHKQESTINSYIRHAKEFDAQKRKIEEEERLKYEMNQMNRYAALQEMQQAELKYQAMMSANRQQSKKPSSSNKYYNPGNAEYHKHLLHTAKDMTDGERASYMKFAFDYLTENQIPFNFEMFDHTTEKRTVHFGFMGLKSRVEYYDPKKPLGKGWLLDRIVETSDDEDYTEYYVLGEDGKCYTSSLTEVYRGKGCVHNYRPWVTASSYVMSRMIPMMDNFFFENKIPLSSQAYMDTIWRKPAKPETVQTASAEKVTKPAEPKKPKKPVSTAIQKKTAIISTPVPQHATIPEDVRKKMKESQKQMGSGLPMKELTGNVFLAEFTPDKDMLFKPSLELALDSWEFRTHSMNLLDENGNPIPGLKKVLAGTTYQIRFDIIYEVWTVDCTQIYEAYKREELSDGSRKMDKIGTIRIVGVEKTKKR